MDAPLKRQFGGRAPGTDRIQGHVCLSDGSQLKTFYPLPKVESWLCFCCILVHQPAWLVTVPLLPPLQVSPPPSKLPLLIKSPPNLSHGKLSNPYLPHCAGCTHSFTLKRDTWTFRGWQRASPLQINRNTCGLWKWGFLCYCFTKCRFGSTEVVQFNTRYPHHLRPRTYLSYK